MKNKTNILSWMFYAGLGAETLAFSPAIPNAFTVPKVVAVLLGAALVAPAVARSYKKVSPIFLLQFLALAVCTILSLNPGVSLWGGDWRRLGLITWLAILIVGAAVPLVIDRNKIRWTHFLRFIVAIGSIAGAYGILQWLNLDPFLPTSVREDLVREFGGAFRSIGTIGQPNYFANYLLYPFFCSLALLRFDADRRWQRFAGLTAVVVLAALLATMSRGAILGAFAGVAVLGGTTLNRRRIATAIVLTTLVSVTLCAVVLQLPFYGKQLQSRLEYIWKDTTGGGRLVLWSDVTRRILPDYWLHGTGPGMFRPAFAYDRSDRYTAFGPDVHWETPHNLFLDRWAEQGIAGLGMLAVFIVAIFSNTRKALCKTSNTRERFAVTAVSCAFVAACIGNLFNGEVIPTAYYFYLWAGLSFATRDCFDGGEATFYPQPARRPGAICFAAAAALSCFLIWHARSNWRAETSLAQAIRATEQGNEAHLLQTGRQSADAFPEKGVYALEFSNLILQFASKQSMSEERRRGIAEIGIDYGMRATTGDRSMLAFYYMSELGSLAGDPRTETWLRKLIAIDPHWYRPHRLLAEWLLQRHRLAEARIEAQSAQHFSPYDRASGALSAQIDKIRETYGEDVQSDRVGERAKALGQIPLTFELNSGQTDSRVEFLARTSSYSVFLSHGEATLAGNPGGTEPVKMKLLGASPRTTASGMEEQPGRANYFAGEDPSKWRTGVPMFGKVAYPEVYPGIDLIYYGNQSQLEYDFVVAPGADPKKIAIGFDGGVESLLTDTDGNLNVRTRSGIMQLQHLRTYQKSGSVTRDIPSRFLIDDRVVRFVVGNYDRTLPLIIDPVLVYSTYLGGTGYDYFHGWHGIATDASGNAYVTGNTNSSDFPLGIPNNASGAFVLKLNAAGTAVVYTTYIGGDTLTHAIAVDASGFAYVTGETTGPGFPISNNAPQASHGGQSDAFLGRLTPAGVLDFATLWGGSGIDTGYAVAVNPSGEAVFTGNSGSSNFPTVNAYQANLAGHSNAFVAKVNPDGSVSYSTYLGGGLDDGGLGAAIDPNGCAYVTGFAYSSNFPVHNALQPNSGGNKDAFITKLNASGTALIYSTFLGGSSWEEGAAIAIDAYGNALVAGNTGSADFPDAVALNSPHGSWDGFVAKLSSSGDTLIFSKYIGGVEEDVATDVGVDTSGNVYVSGYTLSDVVLFTPDQLQPTRGGLSDAFLLKLDGSGSTTKLWTYLGGAAHDFGAGMAIDASGNALIAVTTASPNFPTAAALSPNYGFGGDIAIAKIGTASDLSITIESTTSETREGAILIFSVTIRNGGPAAATGVVMNGFVPSGTVFSSLTTTQGSCGPEGADHSIACSLGTIADGQSVLVVLQVRVTASAGTSISASAWLNADSDDLYAANNAAQVAIAILRSRAGQITSQ